MNSAYYKNNLILSLCVKPYSRPLAKCFVTPGKLIFSVLEVLKKMKNGPYMLSCKYKS